MSRLYLIEFSYRSIKLFNFMKISIENWEKTPQLNSKNEKIKLSDRQTLFRQINDKNLIEYQNEEKKDVKNPKEINQEKVEIIRAWAQKNNFKLSKELTFEEIYLIYEKIFKLYIEKLRDLKQSRNYILQLLFPQITKNLFDSLELLNEIKSIFYEEKNIEKNNYTNLLLESEKQENAIKKDEIAKINKIKEKYEKQINSMNEKIKELEKDKLEIKKKEYQNRKDEDFQEKNEEDNEFAIKKDFNEKDFYQSIIIGNEILQSQINELKDSLENEKTERQKLAIELSNLKTVNKNLEIELSNLKTVNKNLEIVNQKLVNDLAKEKAERVDFQNQLMISFENQFNEIMKKMKEEHKKQK